MDIITSRHNATVKKIRELKKRAARDMLGLAFVEGKRLVNEALRGPARAGGGTGCGGTAVRSLCVSEGFYRGDGFGAIKKIADEYGIELSILADRVFDAVSGTLQPQGLLAVIEMYAYTINDLTKNTGEPSRILMLDRVRDPGNAGAMLRTAEAAGFSGAVFSEGAVDIYEPKTMRATMGAVFRVPFLRGADLYETVKSLREAGYRIYASAATESDGDKKGGAGPRGSAVDCFGAELSGGDIALIIGGEAFGIDERLLDICDATLSIPMGGEAESLNAGVAAGILMYEFARRDRAGTDNNQFSI
ncbi:MAG: RNA methyltransferase [Oscillospiraceae bacterium]|nr:RNA methyltransferase [Oscillospiraceae bacterium]